MEKRVSLREHAASGAMFASLLGVLAVLQYLFTAGFGVGVYGRHFLFEYVIGAAYSPGGYGADALFVIFARFLIVFVISWLPITTLIAYILCK